MRKKKPAKSKPAPKAKSPKLPPAPPRAWRSRIVGHGEVSAEELLANPLNWRKHPKSQEQALEGVLKEVGWVQDVIVNQRSGRLVDGHLRAALAKSKNEKVPVVYVDLSEEEERLILASIDPLAAMAERDDALWASLTDDLHSDNAALEALLHVQVETVPAYVEGEDDAPACPTQPVTVSGDLWLLGEHRVLCGDSTSTDATGRLVGARLADLVFTSPPYDQQRQYEGEASDWLELMQGVFSVLPITEAAQVFVNLGLVHREGEWIPYWEPWIEFMRAAGWRRFAWYTCGIKAQDCRVIGTDGSRHRTSSSSISIAFRNEPARPRIANGRAQRITEKGFGQRTAL